MQVIKHDHYDALLSRQHVSETSLKAKRGNIFAEDKADKHIQLTENITMYNMFVDPKFIWDKERFIDLITPIVYKHFCEIYGMQQVTDIQCIRNIQHFAQTEILPSQPQFFYYGSWIFTPGYDTYDLTWYNNQIEQILSWFNKNAAINLIKTRLHSMIYIGIRPRNYLWFFSNNNFLEDLEKLNLPYVDILGTNYVYVVPKQVGNVSRDIVPLKNILKMYGYLDKFPNLERSFYEQENRYVKIFSDANPLIAQDIRSLKIEYFWIRSSDRIPLLHGLGMESYTRRYYQYGSFLSNVLWFVDKNNNAYYGIEQYFDPVLRGQDGRIMWRASAWIGPIWANEFELQQAQDGNDVYLTIDIGLQKELENILQRHHSFVRGDSISVLIYDPHKWHIKASATYPSYNPNNYNDAFLLQALTPEYRYIVDDLSYVDHPVYIYTGWAYRIATSIEREDVELEKYIPRNVYWPQVLVDKNVSMAYEPGSVFKAFTLAIGLDTDEIRFYDPYHDPWQVKVGQFTIKNVESICEWDSNFLHAFVRSCNVGMVRIAQRLGKEVFYNYMTKLGFGKMTWIELANEDRWFVESVTTVSDARFFNNTFWQWLLVTPIQLAAWYGAIVNGGYYVQPTILKGIYDHTTDSYIPNTTTVLRQIFRPETAEAMKLALFSVLEQNQMLARAKVDGVDLWGKSWTSQVSYRWKYHSGIWWTHWSFVGVITRDNPEYIVIVQVRRPRVNIRWAYTAGQIFGDVAKFIVNYSLIEK